LGSRDECENKETVTVADVKNSLIKQSYVNYLQRIVRRSRPISETKKVARGKRRELEAVRTLPYYDL
jgi:hypothetical protein